MNLRCILTAAATLALTASAALACDCGVRTAAPVTAGYVTGYAPAYQSPVAYATNYAPVTYSTYYAPAVSYAAAPVAYETNYAAPTYAAAAPAYTTYYAAPTTTYATATPYATYYAPATATPYATYYAAPVAYSTYYYGVPGTSIYGTPQVYMPGQPVRNTVRALTP